MSRMLAVVAMVMLLVGDGRWLAQAQAADRPGVAVVELFTSEGCSSCPPADRVLLKLAEQQAKSKDAVYCLSFHVDYWNQLGWPDRFAQRRYTERQRQYAEALDTDRVYTPQMIVNGQIEFVGSNGKLADRAIAVARDQAAEVDVTLTPQRFGTNQLRVHFQLKGDIENASINVALVESGLQSNVKRGENAGATLKHANVVRVFESVELKSKPSGDVDLALPKDLQLNQSRAIVFVQKQTTRQVLGANQTDLLSTLAPASR